MFQISTDPGNFKDVKCTITGQDKRIKTVKVHETSTGDEYIVWQRPVFLMSIEVSNTTVTPVFTGTGGTVTVTQTAPGFFDVTGAGHLVSIQCTKYAGFITSATIISNLTITDYSNMFKWSALKVFDDHSGRAITNLKDAFSGAPLTEFCLNSTMNTKDCEDFSGVFIGSFNNQDVTIDFDTQSATNMDTMFGSAKVTELDISSFNTTSLTTARNMFYDSKVETIKMFSGSPAASFDQFFERSSKLKCLDQIDTRNATNTTNMFKDTTLNNPDATAQATILAGAKWTNSYSCPNEQPPGPFTSFSANDTIGYVKINFTLDRGIPAAQVDLYVDGVKTVEDIQSGYEYQIEGSANFHLVAANAFGTQTSGTKQAEGLLMGAVITVWSPQKPIVTFKDRSGEVDQSNIIYIDNGDGSWTAKHPDAYYMGMKTNANDCDTWTKVRVDSSRTITNCSNMFAASYFPNDTLTEIDLTNFDTKNVTSFQMMFLGTKCELDVSGFDTSSATSMQGMFDKAKSQTIDVSGFDTSKVTNTMNMFLDTVAPLDVSGFDTSKVTTMQAMFNSAKSQTIDVSGFDTSKVTTFFMMFNNTKIQTIDVSGFDVSHATGMFGLAGVFWNCVNLTAIDVSNWDTTGVTDMNSLFSSTTLSSYDISNFDMDSVINSSGMFRYCYEVTHIKLPDMPVTEDTNAMFNACGKLVCVNQINTTSSTNTANMFNDCIDLVAPNSADQALIEAGANWINPNSCP